MNKTLLTAALVIVGGASLFAGDIFRFRGENSQGMYMEEKGLMKSWPQGGLTPKWTYTGLGEGWTSPIKVGNRLYISGSDMNSNPKKEKVVCLDLDGKLIWQTPTGVRWERSFPGARSTPTYVPGEKEGEGRLVVTTGPGELYCLNAADGKILWQKNIANEYGSKFGMWAMAECPVVKDGVVFVTACGSKALVVALKVSDGSVVWTAKSNNDTLDEMYENREQIEIVRRYEMQPKPTLEATEEYLEGKIYFRNPAKESAAIKQAEAIDEEIKAVEG